MNYSEEFAHAARNYGIPLDPSTLQKADAFVALMLERNPKVNLTADADPESLYLRHLADALPAAAYLKSKLGPAPRIADLGSGGGFIGFALKLGFPQAEVTMIESLQRKYDFLNVAALRSGLKGLRVVKARAGYDGVRGDFDALVERALAPLPQAIAWAIPLVKKGGLFVAFQSEPPDPAEPEVAKALSKAGARFVESVTYRLPREDKDRALAVFARED